MSTPTPLDAIINLPLLTAEEERELGRLIQRNGAAGKAALATMTERNLRLVGSIAAKFVGKSSLDYDDLFQEGVFGLDHAGSMFDPERGYKFSTYASYWIRQSIQRALSQQGLMIRLPVHAHDAACRLTKTLDELGFLNGYRPTIDQIADRTGLSVDEVVSQIADKMGLSPEKIIELFGLIYQPDSLDRLLNDNDDATTFYSYQPDDTIPQPDKAAEQNILREEIAAALSILTAREAKIIKLRYGLDDGCSRTLTEVGDIFGLSRERIRQIEGEALKKLRKSARVLVLREFVEA